MSAEDTGAAVVDTPEAETAVAPDTRGDTQRKRQPPYNVILWNDDDHTYEYVVRMLQKLFGHPIEQGALLAKEVDTQGRAIVYTTTREHAELKRDQIHAFGKDDLMKNCKGSMKATIEPVS